MAIKKLAPPGVLAFIVACGVLLSVLMRPEPDRSAPVFLLADDDEAALGRLLPELSRDWFFIPITQSDSVLRYSERFNATAVFLADRIRFPNGGAKRLLGKLVEHSRRPVVILTELWDADAVKEWKRRGAFDCIPHPTRSQERLKRLRETMQKIYLSPEHA